MSYTAELTAIIHKISYWNKLKQTKLQINMLEVLRANRTKLIKQGVQNVRAI